MNELQEIDVALFVSVLQKQGLDITVADVIQTLMESDDTYSTNDGKTIRVYKHGTDDLLMTMFRNSQEDPALN